MSGGPALRGDTLLLFAGVLGVLACASLIGVVLKRRVAHGQPHVVIDNLTSRVNAWWAMVAVLGVAFAFGRNGVVVLFLFISYAALREYVTLAYTRSGDHMTLAVMFYLVLPTQYFLIWIEWYGLYSIFIPVHAFLVLPILASLGGDTTRFLERTAKLQWGLMICVFCLSHVPALLTLDIPCYEGRHLLLIAWLIIVVQGSDVLQYVCGKLAGRRPVAPTLSPSKTVEGTISRRAFPRWPVGAWRGCRPAPCRRPTTATRTDGSAPASCRARRRRGRRAGRRRRRSSSAHSA